MGSSKSFEDLVRESGWTEKDGPYPGVFSKRPAGHRCLWSVRWFAEDGEIDPMRIAPADPKALDYEAADLEGRKKSLEGTLLQSGELAQVRGRYPEYAWPYGGKFAGLVVTKIRPGWPIPAWVKLDGAPPPEAKRPPEENPQAVDYPNGARYEPAGSCQTCGVTVYQCVTHPVRDAEMDNSNVAVYVPGGGGGEVSLFCLKHDPNAAHKRRVGRPAGEPIQGDTWQPLAGTLPTP